MRLLGTRSRLRIAAGILSVSGVAIALAFCVHPGVAEPRPAQTKLAPVPALSPFIEVHSHVHLPDPTAGIEAALRTMPMENAAKVIFLPSPFAPGQPGHFDDEVLMAAEKGHRDKFAFLGGGGTLNIMIQQAVRSGNDGPEVRKKFRERAEEIMRQGASGFGEMTAEHFATGPGGFYEYAPPDHPLFLMLIDISAEHDGAPISLHMEAVPHSMPLPPEMKSPPNPPRLHADIAAFERLLAHNPRGKVLWAHEGWDNTGYRTVALSRRLLRAHPNLYMELKIDPANTGKNSPLTGGGSGAIKPEWMKLFQDFPDRFVIGSDQVYPEPKKKHQNWESSVLLLNQLPADLRRKIGFENAARLYHLK
jgi:predicted TIM-barrel fold metal-dependent hydrolase